VSVVSSGKLIQVGLGNLHPAFPGDLQRFLDSARRFAMAYKISLYKRSAPRSYCLLGTLSAVRSWLKLYRPGYGAGCGIKLYVFGTNTEDAMLQTKIGGDASQRRRAERFRQRISYPVSPVCPSRGSFSSSSVDDLRAPMTTDTGREQPRRMATGEFRTSAVAYRFRPSPGLRDPADLVCSMASFRVRRIRKA